MSGSLSCKDAVQGCPVFVAGLSESVLHLGFSDECLDDAQSSERLVYL